MKISYRSVLLWGLAALVCIFLLSMRTYAGEAGPGAGLLEYSNNHGGILYQGDPKNETGDAVGSADTSGVITDDPEAGAAAEAALEEAETAAAAGEAEQAAAAEPQTQEAAAGETTKEGEVYIHDGVRYTKGELKGSFRLSGYDNEGCCTGNPGGKTYSGTTPRAGHTVAADLSVLPIGTMIIVEGESGKTVHQYDGVYRVEDMGGGVNGSHLDIYCSTHREAAAVTDPGWQKAKVWIAVPEEA